MRRGICSRPSASDADLALARVFHEQERAYMLLRMNGSDGGEGSDYGSLEAGIYEYDEDAEEDYEEDVRVMGTTISRLRLRVRATMEAARTGEGDGDDDLEAEGEGEDEGSEESEYEEGFDEDVELELDHAEYKVDEDYASTLQDAEECEVAARLMDLAGISYCECGFFFSGHFTFRAVDHAEYEVEDYATTLQDTEECEVAARFMELAGISDWRAVEHAEDHINDTQELWHAPPIPLISTWRILCLLKLWIHGKRLIQELVALGEVVDTESRGLSADTLASLPSVTYKTKDIQDGNTEPYVQILEGELLVALPCNHSYHPDCINQLLQINKVCLCVGQKFLPQQTSRPDQQSLVLRLQKRKEKHQLLALGGSM